MSGRHAPAQGPRLRGGQTTQSVRVRAMVWRNTPDTEGSWQRTGPDVPYVRLEPLVPAMRLQPQASLRAETRRAPSPFWALDRPVILLLPSGWMVTGVWPRLRR